MKSATRSRASASRRSVVENPVAGGPPFLIAERHESDDLPTVLTYGHGDVVRGYDEQWRAGLKPWEIVVDGDRWYGRGTADNKGQHSVNFAALAAVLAGARRQARLQREGDLRDRRGDRLAGPRCKSAPRTSDALAADVFIASDGPRVSAERPTLFLGSRGGVHVRADGRICAKAAITRATGAACCAIRPSCCRTRSRVSSIATARIAVEGLRPPPISDAVREALADIELGRDESSPDIDRELGRAGPHADRTRVRLEQRSKCSR